MVRCEVIAKTFMRVCFATSTIALGVHWRMNNSMKADAHSQAPTENIGKTSSPQITLQQQILNSLNLEINKQEILGMLGPNGVGKSTIFNLVTGLIKPNKGDIIIKNEKVNEYPIFMSTSKFKIGYVPQYGGYFYDLTLYENLKAVAGEVIVLGTSTINATIPIIR